MILVQVSIFPALDYMSPLDCSISLLSSSDIQRALVNLLKPFMPYSLHNNRSSLIVVGLCATYAVCSMRVSGNGSIVLGTVFIIVSDVSGKVVLLQSCTIAGLSCICAVLPQAYCTKVTQI